MRNMGGFSKSIVTLQKFARHAGLDPASRDYIDLTKLWIPAFAGMTGMNLPCVPKS